VLNILFVLMTKLIKLSQIRTFLIFWTIFLLPSHYSNSDVLNKITWKKDLTRGRIESYQIEVNENGQVTYQFFPDQGEVVLVNLRLSSKKVDFLLDMFSKADFLNKKKKFVSSRRVSSTGINTIRLESGLQQREIVFRYTENKILKKIILFFNQLSQQEQSLFEMDIALRYDRLGILKRLDQLDRYLQRKELIDPKRFIPVLEKISTDKSLINLAQKQARQILHQINNRTY